MRIDITLKNVAKAIETFDRLEPIIQNKVLAQMTRAGGNIILPAAKAATSMFQYKKSNPLPKGRKKGDIKRGLKVRALPRKAGRIGVSVISSLKDKSGEERMLYHGAFVNWGHKIGRRPGKGQTDSRTRKVKPVPYMNKAFQRSRRQAMAVMTSLFKAGVKREWKAMWGK
jgi:HK97 gp10 family phage protein